MTVLDEAAEIIYGDGERTHGHPAKNLTVIANMWEQYLYSRGLLNTNSEGLMPQDVALMMSLLKIAILANRPDHKVSLVDACGYLGLVERCEEDTHGS